MTHQSSDEPTGSERCGALSRGNTLSEDQIRTILEGKTVVAAPREIQEVRNAIVVYEKLLTWNPTDTSHLLEAHQMMMVGLLDQASDQVTKLLKALKRGPLSAAQIMSKLGLAHKPSFRQRYLHPALDAGLVEMTNPSAPNAANQKYRLVH